MSEGIDKITSVLNAGNAIAVKLIELSKDGLQLSDVAALLADEELKKLLLDASEAIDGIKNQIEDVNLNEGIELGMVQLAWIPHYVTAIKKA